MIAETSITVTFDLTKLSTYTDEFLAQLWHLGQMNTAPYGDYTAGQIVQFVGWEIIGRWLRKAPIDMYHHQPEANVRKALTDLARYVPPDDAKTGGIPGVTDPHWYEGTWVVKDPAAEEKALADQVQQYGQPAT